ncbi:MAG: DUF2129 domain-containing protein [Bacillaceae bacterium]|nr:DUF2129 domain-containing protein [Bacillaceae bacterium]
MKVKRVGLAVWVKNTRAARNLRKFGNIHYVSRRMKYVSMYVDADRVDQIIRRIQQFKFVTRVERSFRHLIPTEYDNARPDQAKEYDYELDKALVTSRPRTELNDQKVDEASL